ncbi:MAG: hypothetical protein JNK43_01765 [Ignavibacteria bacterium]|nr:hypothetical protein [Ignavibacteria bacterium]
MKNTLLILNSLDAESLEKFGEYLKSPFFNGRSDLIKLYNYIKKKLPLPELNREEVYIYVYGPKNYNKQVMINLLSRTQKHLLNFLTVTGLMKDEAAKTNALSFELARRGHNRLAGKTIENAIANLKNEFYTIEYLKKYYDYTELKESLVVSLRNFRQKTENALNRGEAFVNYYILNLLRIANDFIVFKYVNSVIESDEIFNGYFKYFDFEKYIENLRLINSPYYAITAVFYYGLQSKMNDPDGKYREELKKTVFDNLDNMKYQDQATCWTLLFAAYIFSNTPPKYDPSREIHEINKFFVSRDILTRDELGYIMENNYHNIAFQAINAGDYDWAEKFLNDYKSKLPPGTPDDTYNICMARSCFERKEYEKSLKYISKMKIDNVMTRTHVATLSIRCYYELGYYEEALSGTEALRQFHKKNKVLPLHLKKPLLVFAKQAYKLIKYKASNRKLPEELYLKALNGAAFNSKIWVIAKMKELL